MAINIARRYLLVPALALSLLAGPASARGVALIRDAEIETTIRTYSTPLFQAAGIDPQAVEVLIVDDPSLNAFVAGGQKIFVHTGLLIATDTPNQLIGVIAHETGHIAGGHLARTHEAMRKASAHSIIAFLLGGAAAIAGQGGAAAAILTAGVTASHRQYLRYSRSQEAAADQSALRTLEATGQSASGLLVFIDKLGDQELLVAESQDPYARTHPLWAERADALRSHYEGSRYRDATDSPQYVALHARMKAKLVGYLKGLLQTLRRYPLSDTSLPARYARAVAYHRERQSDKAIGIVDGLLAEHPDDPYFHELKGQILLESRRIDQAIPSYQRSVDLDGDNALLRMGLGQAQVSAEGTEHVAAAIENLKIATRIEPHSPGVWRWLAMAYGRDEQLALAALATAERYVLLGRYRDAKLQATRALKGLSKSSPAYLRALDLEGEAQHGIERKRKQQ
ncbi:MAG: M48 family metalloprotease [Alphaproteobacteria bacterium]|nr:M48 family metalloprotease [Alphaproteobacteria bacterium]